MSAALVLDAGTFSNMRINKGVTRFLGNLGYSVSSRVRKQRLNLLSIKSPFLRDPLVRKAFEIALFYHKGQLRKGGAPYIIHPLAVAALLYRYGYSSRVIAAGLLHDVLEDTGCEREDLERKIGKDVTRIVIQVTDRDKTAVWTSRKADYLRLLERASRPALAVACADKTDNISSLLEPQFSYRPGKKKFLNYQRIYKLIKKRYPSCVILKDYSQCLKKLECLIG